MRKPLFYLLTFICITLTNHGYSQYSGDSWEKTKSSGNGTISVAFVETPGFVYKNNAGVLSGICVDIMNDFLAYVNSKGVKVKADYVGDGSSFRGMYDKVKASNGGVFGLGNITITEARKSEIKFSPSWITNFAILITQNNVPTLNSLSSIAKTFNGLTAYTAKGTLNEKRLLDIKSKYYPDMKISYASSSPETLDKVLADPNSFTYLDLAFYLDAVSKRRPLKRHPVGDQSSEQFGFIMPMNSDWQPIMEEFFAANGGYINSTKYKQILSRHLGSTGVKLLQTAK